MGTGTQGTEGASRESRCSPTKLMGAASTSCSPNLCVTYN